MSTTLRMKQSKRAQKQLQMFIFIQLLETGKPNQNLERIKIMCTHYTYVSGQDERAAADDGWLIEGHYY